MAFTIDGFDNVEFDIPNGKSKRITISVPPLDCITPQDMDKIKARIADVETLTAIEATRIFLLELVTSKAAREAIEALPARQISQIDEIWSKESGLSVGESEDSTDTSVETQN